MKATIGFIAVLFLFSFSFVRPVFAAANISPISANTTSPIIGDSFSVTASISGALSGNIYFVKCRIGPSSSSLTDGQTHNSQTDKWLDDTGSNGSWVDMPQITVIRDDGIWSGQIECRVKSNSTNETKSLFMKGCLNLNNSCNSESSFQSSSSLTLGPQTPTPTLTPTPTPAPTSTTTPTPAPTSSPTNTPTPTPTRTPTPTPVYTPTRGVISSLVPTQGEVLSTSVLGETTQAGGYSLPTMESSVENAVIPSKIENTKSTRFQKISILIGIVFILACTIVTFRMIKKGGFSQSEEQ